MPLLDFVRGFIDARMPASTSTNCGMCLVYHRVRAFVKHWEGTLGGCIFLRFICSRPVPQLQLRFSVNA